MAISSDQNRRTYSGDGSSAVFNYPYEFHADSDVAVLVYNSSRSTITAAQALTTNYTISGNKDLQGRYLNGANIVFNSAPATGDEISIFGSTTVNSAYALGFNENISRPDLVKALDRLVLINQRLNDQATRAMRLQDSFPYTFDTRLPERLTPNAPIIVNSGGVGFNTGLITNSSGFAGVFPLAQGGLGASLVASTGMMLYAVSPTEMGLLGRGGQDQVLIYQSSHIPSWGGISLISNSSATGVLPAAKGGTAHSSFVQASLVYASSTSILSFIANGGADQPLIGNNGAAPSYQPLNLASGSSVTNILSTSRGGTGNSGYVQYGVAYFETASQFGVVPSAANGRVLTCHGSSAPTWDAIPPDALVAPTSVSTDYTATTDDEVLLVDGSGASLTIRLFDATASSGDKILIKKIDSSTNSITIDGSSSQTIDGDTTTTLNTQYESLNLLSDGSNWHVLQREIKSQWSSFTPTGSWTTGTTVYTGYLRRVGDELIVRVKVETNAAPNAANLDINLPSGYVIDTAKLPHAAAAEVILGKALIYDNGVTTYPSFVLFRGTTVVTVRFMDDAAAGVTASQATQAAPFAFGSTDLVSLDFSVPIVGWKG